MSSSAAYSMTPAPPNTMSSPGPPNVSAATVSSQHHNGSAASRGADVHCSAAHTSAALSMTAEQRADGKRHRSDTERKKESGRYRGEDTVNR